MERSVFAQGYVRVNLLFFPSVSCLCLSTLEIWLSQQLLVEIIRFLKKDYDGLTIYHIPTFWPSIIFSWFLFLGEKNSLFGFFKGLVFRSCPYRKLENAHLFALANPKPFRWTARSGIFVIMFFGQFFPKNDMFWILWLFGFFIFSGFLMSSSCGHWKMVQPIVSMFAVKVVLLSLVCFGLPNLNFLQNDGASFAKKNFIGLPDSQLAFTYFRK